MTTALERSLEEFVHDLLCCLVVDEASRHNQNISVVVLACELCNLRIPYQCCTYALVLVESHCHAFTATADTDTWINVAVRDSFAQLVCKVRIVAAQIAVCSVILKRNVVALKVLNNKFLQCVTCVVACNAYCLNFRYRGFYQ